MHSDDFSLDTLMSNMMDYDQISDDLHNVVHGDCSPVQHDCEKPKRSVNFKRGPSKASQPTIAIPKLIVKFKFPCKGSKSNFNSKRGFVERWGE